MQKHLPNNLCFPKYNICKNSPLLMFFSQESVNININITNLEIKQEVINNLTIF